METIVGGGGGVNMSDWRAKEAMLLVRHSGRLSATGDNFRRLRPKNKKRDLLGENEGENVAVDWEWWMGGLLVHVWRGESGRGVTPMGRGAVTVYTRVWLLLLGGGGRGVVHA